MIIEGIKLKPARVEIIKRVYNKQNQITMEQVEFYYPEEFEDLVIGFKPKKRYAKKTK